MKIQKAGENFERGGFTRMLGLSSTMTDILQLAVPTVVSLSLHSALLAEEAALLGKLSATKLAGAALCFPWLTLMAMMSAGGLGGGVSSALARARGAGRLSELPDLMGHSLALAGLMGGAMALGLGYWHQEIFAWQGGTGDVALTASVYGSVTLASGVFIWAANILSSIFRGLGNTLLPAKWGAGVTLIAACVIPPVVLGWGPIPQTGVTGAAWVMAGYYFALTVTWACLLLRHETTRDGAKRAWKFSVRHFADILHVGGPSAFNTLLSSGLMLLATTIAAHFGNDALAAFGAATRIEGLLMPFVFGIGSALVPLVGMNVGAGEWGSVRRIAWTGAGLGWVVAGVIGMLMWIFPETTIRVFTNDPGAVVAGVQYLRHSAWGYGFWGLGVGMTFSCQGARRPITSLVASAARFAYVGAGGWWLLRGTGHTTSALGLLMGSSAAVFGFTAVLLAGPLLPEWMALKRQRA